MEKSEDIVPSFALSSNSRYEATAFGFCPNSRFAQTFHIGKTLDEISPKVGDSNG